MTYRATFECQNRKIVNTCKDHCMKLRASLPVTTHWPNHKSHSIIIRNMKFTFHSKFSSGNGINVMDWPTMSADMSPIEHAWDELGRRVRNRVPPPANVAQLSQMLIQEWNNIPQLRIQNFFSVNGSSLSSVHTGERWSKRDILNQTYNTTRKWLDFCMNMWCKTLYLRHIAQLLTKNLWYTVYNVSTAWFS